jgi:hypothetical protein
MIKQLRLPSLFDIADPVVENVHDRFAEYDKEHCWQYEIRQQNKSGDVLSSGLTHEEIKNLKTSDFKFEYVPAEDKKTCREIVSFIEKHEWLGKMPIWLTHRFTVRLKKNNILAGVCIMATPNAFSHLLGEEYRDVEKLIARGACISWSPKNLGSWLTMQAIRWMVKNTEFRIFTAYSDPEAKELGTIYQACNFYYLGQKFGNSWQYLDPNNKKRGWFGDTGFNDRSQIIRYAKELGIVWQPEWYKVAKSYRKVDWKKIPEDIAKKLKQRRQEHKDSCKKRKTPAKHKYCYVLGKTPSETKKLRSLFLQKNTIFPYPKERGQ